MEMPPIDFKTWMTFGNILPDQKTFLQSRHSLAEIDGTRIYSQFFIIFLAIFIDSFQKINCLWIFNAILRYDANQF